MCEQKFFRCKHCGNLVGLINNAGVPMTCCDEPMEELVANSVEAATEKHIPEVSVHDRLVHVQIGSVIHPMLDEHYIEFIYLQTEKGGQRKCFKPGETPSVMFVLDHDAPVAVFAYCNIHGLWKTDLKNCDCEGDCTCE